MNNEIVAKFKLWFGKEQLSEIIDITKFDYEIIDNMVYVYKLISPETIKTLEINECCKDCLVHIANNCMGYRKVHGIVKSMICEVKAQC